MTNVRWDIGWGAVLLLSLAYFFDDTGLFAACIPAVLAHELGHVAALRYFGARIRKVSIKAYGAKIDYSGILGNRERSVALAAGPAAGAVYCVLAYFLLGSFGKLSAAASAVMTIFNALPIMPLDGGQITAYLLSKEKSRMVSLCFAALLCTAALLLLKMYCAAAPLAVSAALLIMNILPEVRK